MARLNGFQIRKAFSKALAAVNQQGDLLVYLAKRVSTGGDNLAFGLGEDVTLTKLLISPSPLIETPEVSKFRENGVLYLEGDVIVTFIPPVKNDNSEYTEDELNAFNEIWVSPISNVGQVKESPAQRYYVRKSSNAKVNGVIVACGWICNISLGRK